MPMQADDPMQRRLQCWSWREPNMHGGSSQKQGCAAQWELEDRGLQRLIQCLYKGSCHAVDATLPSVRHVSPGEAGIQTAGKYIIGTRQCVSE